MGRSSTWSIGSSAFAVAATLLGCTPHDASRETTPVESAEPAAVPPATGTTVASAARIQTVAPPETPAPTRYKPPALGACALVSADEVKAAVGFVGARKLATTSDDREACTWEEPGKSAIIVKLISAQDYDEGKHIASTRKRPETVAGLGDAAFYTAISSKTLQGGVVMVRKGEAAASVQVLLMGSRLTGANAKKRSIAIAKLVAAKL